MKRLIVVGTLLLAVTGSPLADPFDELEKSLAAVIAASSVMQIGNYQYDGSEAIWGAYLDRSNSIRLRLYFDQGEQYLLLAGDNTSTKIDLVVRDEQTNDIVASDEGPEQHSVCRVYPLHHGRIHL